MPGTVVNTKLACETVKSEIIRALDAEIGALQRFWNSKLQVFDGFIDDNESSGYFYNFSIEQERSLPAETPVKLDTDDFENVNGIVVSCGNYHIRLKLERNVGRYVEEANLWNSPWQIDEKLKQRFCSLCENGGLNRPKSQFLLGNASDSHINNSKNGISEQTLDELIELVSKNIVIDDAKRKSVSKCANSNMHFIWGPPGTGKTNNLAQISRLHNQLGERVMILSTTNIAVDTAMLMVARAFHGTDDLKDGRILRVGYSVMDEARAAKAIIPYEVVKKQKPDLFSQLNRLNTKLNDLKKTSKTLKTTDEKLNDEISKLELDKKSVYSEISKLQAELISRAKVIGLTLSKHIMSDGLFDWQADTVLIDEASMVKFPYFLVHAIRAGKRLHIFGDFKQLAPICQNSGSGNPSQEAEKWLARDVYEISGIKGHILEHGNHPRVTLLNKQYRMRREIADLVSEFSYNKLLETPDEVHERNKRLSDYPPSMGKPVVLLNTELLHPGCHYEYRSKINPLHAILIVHIVRDLESRGARGISVITPYRQQADLIKRLLRRERNLINIKVATIHSFQGSESNIVIFDTVDSYPLHAEKNCKFTGIDEEAMRIFNVAMSRPRGKLIVIANRGFFREVHSDASYGNIALSVVEKHGHSIDLSPEIMPDMPKVKDLKWFESWDDVQVKLHDSIIKAENDSSLYINLPWGYRLNEIVIAEILQYAEYHDVCVNDVGLMNRALNCPNIKYSICNVTGSLIILLYKDFAILGGTDHTGGHGIITNRMPVKAVKKMTETMSKSLVDKLNKLIGKCEICGYQLLIQGSNRIWKFKCPKCNNIVPLDKNTLFFIAYKSGIRCSQCGSILSARSTDNLFTGCKSYPQCRSYEPSISKVMQGVKSILDNGRK